MDALSIWKNTVDRLVAFLLFSSDVRVSVIFLSDDDVGLNELPEDWLSNIQPARLCMFAFCILLNHILCEFVN